MKQLPALLLLLLLLALLVAAPSAAQTAIRGRVVDAVTTRELSDVHVYHPESGRGTVTNRDGRFELALPRLPTTVIFRHVGYTTFELRLEEGHARERTIGLEQSVVPLGEIVVAGDGFEESVMRAVIRRKQRQEARRPPYSARVYARTTLQPIAGGNEFTSVREVVYDMFDDRRSGRREVLRSDRETDALYAEFGLPRFGQLPNLYDDQIDLGYEVFVGPTSPDALDRYTFTFGGTRAIDGRPVYDLYVAPKSDAFSTLIGTISVLPDDSVMVEAFLRPARHVVPQAPVADWAVSYRQVFAEQNSAVWLPVSLRAEGRIGRENGAQTTVGARLVQIAAYSEYDIGRPIPADILRRDDRQQIDTMTVLADFGFTLGSNIVPLTPAETIAYIRRGRDVGRLRSAFRQGARRDVLAVLTPRVSEADGVQYAWPTISEYTPYFRFNRVDGFLSGVGQLGRPGSRSLLEWRLSQATGWRAIRYRIRYEHNLSDRIAVGAALERDAVPTDIMSTAGTAFSGLGSLLGRGDYSDYFASRSRSASIRGTFGPTRTTVTARLASADSVSRQITEPWFGDNAFRINPPVDPGLFGELELRLAAGDHARRYARRAPTRAELRVVGSPVGLLDSHGYALANLTATTGWDILLRQRRNPIHLDAGLTLGGSSGSGPYQWTLDGVGGGLSPFGAVRTSLDRPLHGRRGALFFWRIDLDRVPLDVIGMDTRRRLGATVAVHGASAVVGPGRGSTTLVHELGFSVSDVLGLPVELLLTRRLDHPRWLLGFTIRP